MELVLEEAAGARQGVPPGDAWPIIRTGQSVPAIIPRLTEAPHGGNPASVAMRMPVQIFAGNLTGLRRSAATGASEQTCRAK